MVSALELPLSPGRGLQRLNTGFSDGEDDAVLLQIGGYRFFHVVDSFENLQGGRAGHSRQAHAAQRGTG